MENINWFWPDLCSIAQTRAATNRAAVAAVVSAVLMLVLIAVGWLTSWALVDASISLACAAGIYLMRSRVAAVLLLTQSIVGTLLLVAEGNVGSVGYTTVLFLALFVGGVRGTFAYDRFNRTSAIRNTTVNA